MTYFDSHCHLDPMRYGGDLAGVLERARAAGVTGMAVIGTRAADSEAAAAIAAREPGLVAAAGIHPNDAAEAEPGEWDRIVRLVESGRVAAVGETGLDWYRTTAPPEVQRDFFDRHIRLAQGMGLPLVIHTRESTPDCLAMLREALGRGPLTVILHSFTGTAAEAAEAVELGFFLGFAGMVTFRSAADLREVAKPVSLAGAAAGQAERAGQRRPHRRLPGPGPRRAIRLICRHHHRQRPPRVPSHLKKGDIPRFLKKPSCLPWVGKRGMSPFLPCRRIWEFRAPGVSRHGPHPVHDAAPGHCRPRL